MGYLKGLFGKKQGACCNVKIEEIKETKNTCCSQEETVEEVAEQKNDTGCK
ncbi:hypothetical protein [Brevibacillus sp. 179-C 1.1 NHS]|uniref:hypothetical protein n=1 Tax=Brevibacillus sp. 179-C 1.1 NHS TaxID=3235177 RepID=UPI0039A1FA9C